MLAVWRRGYWGSWRQAWVGCGRHGDRPLEIWLVVASGKLFAYSRKEIQLVIKYTAYVKVKCLKSNWTRNRIYYGSYTLLELKWQNALKGSRIIITLLIWNKTPFFMECYVGHFALFEIYVVDTIFWNRICFHHQTKVTADYKTCSKIARLL